MGIVAAQDVICPYTGLECLSQRSAPHSTPVIGTSHRIVPVGASRGVAVDTFVTQTPSSVSLVSGHGAVTASFDFKIERDESRHLSLRIIY